MRKIPNLTEILQRVEKAIEKHRDETKKIIGKVIDEIYSQRDAKYIDAVANFFEQFERNARTGALERRIGGLTSYLTRGEEKEREALPEEKQDRVNMQGAAKYWMQLEKDEGKKVPSSGAYQHRIRLAAKKGKIKIEDEGRGKQYISLHELRNYITERSKQIQTPSVRERKTEKEPNSYETYASLRNSGMSREEVIQRHPHLCPQGKDPRKFFGALEGCYKKYRVGKKSGD